MNRHIKVVLALSLMLNMLLAGMVLGDVLHGFLPPAAFNISTQLEKLPEDKRALFTKIMGPAKKRMDAEKAQMDDAKKEAVRLLKAEPFSEEAYLTQTHHINDMRAQMKRHIAEAVATLAKQLTQDERGILAEIVSHPPFSVPPGAQFQEVPAPPAQ